MPVPNIFQLGAGSLNSAGGALERTIAPGAIAQSMNSYLNPYMTGVIDNSVSRLRDRRSADLNMLNAGASEAGAYGGSRHGVASADLLDNYGRGEDELVSRLLQQGFDTSAGLATAEQGLMQSGANGLMNLGQTATGIGQRVQQNQMQTGTMQQQLLQAILGGASGQFDQYSNYPIQQLSTLLSALSGNPLSGNATQTSTPGLFDYLSMATSTATAGK